MFNFETKIYLVTPPFPSTKFISNKVHPEPFSVVSLQSLIGFRYWGRLSTTGVYWETYECNRIRCKGQRLKGQTLEVEDQ